MLAAAAGSLPAVTALVKAGANVLATAAAGQTAAQLAGPHPGVAAVLEAQHAIAASAAAVATREAAAAAAQSAELGLQSKRRLAAGLEVLHAAVGKGGDVAAVRRAIKVCPAHQRAGRCASSVVSLR